MLRKSAADVFTSPADSRATLCQVLERWWDVAGRFRAGSGIREPGEWCGEPFTLRKEDVLFTSLFRACNAGKELCRLLVLGDDSPA